MLTDFSLDIAMLIVTLFLDSLSDGKMFAAGAEVGFWRMTTLPSCTASNGLLKPDH